MLMCNAAQGQDSSEAFVSLPASEVDYQSSDRSTGFASAILFGDPSKDGIYVLRLKVDAGFLFSPHYHDQDRHVTVISGVWAFGMGPSGTCEDTVPLVTGAYVMHPKGAVHFDGSCTDQPVEVQIIGMGPVTTHGVDSD